MKNALTIPSPIFDHYYTDFLQSCEKVVYLIALGIPVSIRSLEQKLAFLEKLTKLENS